MYIKKSIVLFPLVISLLLLIFSCGNSTIEGTGGSGGGETGASSRVMSIGAVSSEDDVIVNNVNYTTNDTTIFDVDGELGAQEDLLLGQVVAVDATVNNAGNGVTTIADNIRYISNVIGPISSTDKTASGFSVLGQKIWVDTATVLGDGVEAFDDLQTETIVRISGLVSSNRDIQATRIDVVATQTYQVIGIIEDLNISAVTFMVNDLQVNYQDAIIEGDLNDGSLVKINTSLLSNESVFYASLVQPLNVSFDKDTSVVSLEGLVTSFISTDAFSVSDFSIIVNSDTVVVNGDLSEISLDARLRVEGGLNQQGVIVAREISIVHTGPTSSIGSVADDVSNIYPLQSNENDTGLWVTLESRDESYDAFDSENYVMLFVDRVENGRRIRECQHVRVTRFDQGACYLENDGRTDWEITVRGRAVSGEVDYKLTSYFRRAPFSVVEDIDVGTPVSVYQSAGDRSLYRVSAENAPKGSFLAVKVDGLQNSGQLYIEGDGSDAAGASRLFDCRLGNQAGDRDEVVERVCWLENEGVNDWYLSLESTANQQYTLHIDFIDPPVLVPGQMIEDAHIGEYGMLYQLAVSEEDSTVGVLMSHVTGDEQSGENALRIRKGVPSSLHDYECFSGQRADYNEQCISANNGSGIWYVLVSGNGEFEYQLIAETQTIQPETVDLLVGDSLQVDHQGVATKAIYRLPQGTLDTVFVVGVTDQTDTDFEIEVRKNLSDESPVCSTRTSGLIDDRHCRVFNEGEGYWYVTVQSAAAGSYYLWTSEQSVIELIPGQALRGQVTASNPSEGALYRVAMPALSNKFIATVSEKTAVASLVARDDRLPNTSFWTCGAAFQSPRVSSCENDLYKPEYWYIYINAEMGAEYTIIAEFE